MYSTCKTSFMLPPPPPTPPSSSLALAKTLSLHCDTISSYSIVYMQKTRTFFPRRSPSLFPSLFGFAFSIAIKGKKLVQSVWRGSTEPTTDGEFTKTNAQASIHTENGIKSAKELQITRKISFSSFSVFAAYTTWTHRREREEKTVKFTISKRKFFAIHILAIALLCKCCHHHTFVKIDRDFCGISKVLPCCLDLAMHGCDCGFWAHSQLLTLCVCMSVHRVRMGPESKKFNAITHSAARLRFGFFAALSLSFEL